MNGESLQIVMWGDTLENIKIDTAKKMKRNWENAFQHWCNKQFQDDTTSCGSCGYGVMCDFCADNSYGRPCVRALNDWLKVRHKTIDYDERDFEKIWRGEL